MKVILNSNIEGTRPVKSPLKLLAIILVLTTNANASSKIMLFGDQNHKKYLGCLNCSEFSPESIHNEFGNYGSEFSVTSINNVFGQYGSEFSPLSACNEFATYPPVVVDDSGNYYGYLTLNDSLSRIESSDMLSWLKYKICSN